VVGGKSRRHKESNEEERKAGDGRKKGTSQGQLKILSLGLGM
jgi:hypothetical protein